MNRLVLVVLGALLIASAGCAAKKPKSFSDLEVTWSTFELREDLQYERAWNAVIHSLVMKNFDLEMALRDEGYVRTAWLYTWSGQYDPGYRVRVIAKFNETRTTLSLKPEAQLLVEGIWTTGSDSQLVSTLKTDIMGLVSGTTR